MRIVESVSLGDIAKVISGFAFKSSEFSDEGVPVVKIANIRVGFLDLDGAQKVNSSYLAKLADKYKVQAGEVLISLTGSHVGQPNSVVGRVGRASGSIPVCLLNQRAGKVIINDKGRCDVGFLYYYLTLASLRGDIAAMASGAASQANVSPAQVESLSIDLPSLNEQIRISSILSAYDNLIENNTRCIEILEEMARRLYEEWFVQFRFPGHEGVEFKESELGLIPEGWKVSTLDEFGEIITGKTPSKNNSEFFGGVVPFIKLPDMHGNTFIVGTSEKLSQQGVNSQKTKTIPPGSICVSCIGTAGVVVITSEPSQTNQQINSIVPRAPSLREFLFFSATALKEKINNYGATGATMTNLSRGKFTSLQIVEPKEDLLCGYNKLAAPLFDKILVLQKANRNLRAQRDLLLPKLISGEIDVSDIPMPT